MGLALHPGRLGDAAARFGTASEYAAAGLATLGGTAIAAGDFGGVPSGSALASALTAYAGQQQASLSAAAQAWDGAAQRVGVVLGLAAQVSEQTAAAAAV